MNRLYPMIVGLVGAAMIAIGVFLNWMEVALVFSDGSKFVLEYTGLEMYTEFEGGEVPFRASAPLLFILISVSVALLSILGWRASDVGSSRIMLFAACVFFAALLVIGMTFVDPAIMAADPPAGTGIAGIADWVKCIADGDVTRASISSGNGILVSIAGGLVALAGAILNLRANTESR